MLKLGSKDLTNNKAVLWVSQPIQFAKFLISNFLKGLTYSVLSEGHDDKGKGLFSQISVKIKHSWLLERG